jgi:hypothetical protein
LKIEERPGSGDARNELATWLIFGVAKDVPDGVPADRVLARMAETIKRLLLGANSAQAFGGLATKIKVPETKFADITGGVGVSVTLTVAYSVSLYDGYR